MIRAIKCILKWEGAELELHRGRGEGGKEKRKGGWGDGYYKRGDGETIG